MKSLFKKGSKVKVCVGKDKGKTGEIIEINRFRNLAKVKGANMQKKHKKATKEISVSLGTCGTFARHLVGFA